VLHKVLASIALLTIMVALHDKSNLYDAHRMLNERPVMNTYFSSGEEANINILSLWNEEWTNAGFTTKILTLEDSKRHPKFEEMANIIEANAIGNADASSYYRWLAVSVTGGGWMSTYDTFPTEFPLTIGEDLPNDGTLTSFQAHIPSLVSGTVDEWDRVIGLFLDVIPRISVADKSATSALEILRHEDTHGIHYYFPPDYVQRGFAYDSPRHVNCDTMSRVRAVHISTDYARDAVMNGLYPVELSDDDPTGFTYRAKAYKTFLQDWSSQCRRIEESGNVESGNEESEGELFLAKSRPVMHTFFHSVDSMATTENKVLELWKMEWGNAGFDPVVLTLDDAKKHADFEEVEKIMIPLHGSTGYNALCFYRWLAMAASGGGWMSDHDTFPTNFPINEGSDLPNEGRFVSYQSHVPALMSGSAEEWDRVSKLIIDAIPRIVDLPDVDENIVTDMHAFYVLHLENNDSISFIPFHAGVQDGYLYESPHKVNCEQMSIGRAVHLSHALTHKAITDGVYPIEVKENDPVGKESRAEGSRVFMDEWRSQCTNSPSVKPIIHTFFHSRSPIEDAVLELWKEEWTAAGFEPVVLTLEDAKRHPDFEEVEKKMIPLHGKTGYDSLCFYRWLAMAASGGGWMSDHDTFPVVFPVDQGLELPNGGTFTSFQGHIPALMSGSEDEWNRVSKLLIDAIPRIEEGGVQSDMYALAVLRQENNAGITFGVIGNGRTVQSGFFYVKGTNRKVNCEQMLQTMAVHMAHSQVHAAVIDGSYPLEMREDDKTGTHRRARASKAFLDDFRAQCIYKIRHMQEFPKPS